MRILKKDYSVTRDLYLVQVDSKFQVVLTDGLKNKLFFKEVDNFADALTTFNKVSENNLMRSVI